jgi:acyl-CoA thioester hydrolase
LAERGGGEVFVTTQKLRFCDTDRLGHVNNAVYNVMCEAGRAELMQEAGLLDPAGGHGVVIARLELDFLREMNWPGEIRIDTAIHRIGQKSIQVHQHLHQADTLVAKATSILAIIDTTKRRAVPITDEWRAALERWLVPEF